MQDRTGLTVFLVRVVFVLFETRRFCKVARFVFPDLNRGSIQLESFFASNEAICFDMFSLNGAYFVSF